jgi:uncharacterized protein (TIGR02246 family)
MTAAALLGLAISAGFGAPAAAQGSAKHIDPTISKVSTAYAAAVNAMDAATLAALYTEDAVEMPPNEKAVHGRPAIEAFYKKQFADTASATSSIKPTESAIAGSIGYEVGTYTQTLKLKSGLTVNDVGKYIVLLKPGTDKQWRVAYVAYNSDNPPPPSAK